MELDFVTSDLMEEVGAMEGGDLSDASNVEGESCGICMDLIVDRGVLDCCQHWFCFECIDNWATITNLCPLCQNEFQSITCVSVCDTTMSNKIDEDSLPRESEWCDDVKDDTPSSPSFYIDENAVICLDGDGCKIRNGFTSMEEDPDFDTSIACDSCDIWYHASCVGFDPEATFDETWLCPRCRTILTPRGCSSVSDERANDAYDFENPIKEQRVEAGFSGNVSVSVADDGETALVVSMIGSDTWSSLANETSLIPEQGNFSRQEDMTEPKVDENSQEGDSIKMPSPHETAFAEASDLKSSPRDDMKDVRGGASKLSGVKRDNFDCSGVEAFCENVVLAKKTKCEETHIIESLRQDPTGEEDGTPDIFSIVKGTEHKSRNRLIENKAADKAANGDSITGLRVKKIMRGMADSKDSSAVVKKLSNEIREVVRDRCTKDIGEKIFDPKLLAAFRVAIAGPKREPLKKLTPLAFKAKKSMLQKGKVRENLTKKIYGDSNGKRRHAWVRECEVEFWKHRCLGGRNPEKIDTLNSVLCLLRKDPDDFGTKQSSDVQASTSVLSRLYLADTSVFPRKKDDARPLSVLTASGNTEQPVQKSIDFVGNNAKVNEVDIISTNSSVANAVDTKPASTKSINAYKAHKMKGNDRPVLGDSRDTSHERKVIISDDWKKDKRKWAMEVLARKKALGNNHTSQEKQEDFAVLKGQYPLLAQLPADMRPVPATSRHNKIPVSIRQAQLYRLTERLLKKLDLPAIQRTAATELAVADAVNIEKEIVNKSSSKVVYLNFCSQEILHYSSYKPSNCTESTGNHSDFPSEKLEKIPEEDIADDPAVQEALQTAGLLSDSTPSSPIQKATALGENESASLDTRKERQDTVLEIDSLQDLDAYGDFNYHLEDHNCIRIGNAKAPKVAEVDCASKVKIDLSTVKCEKSQEELNTSLIDRPTSPPNQLNISSDNGVAEKSSPTDDGCEKARLLSESSPKEGEELSLVQREELYGLENRETEVNVSLTEASEKLIESQVEISHAANPATERATSIHVPGPTIKATDSGSESNVHGEIIASNFEHSSNGNPERKEKKVKEEASTNYEKQRTVANSVFKKVEAFIKEHLRPLCKSGIITSEQYRWAAAKSAEKVMKYHSNAKNANFLIKEGEKVKRLAEQYLEASQQKGEK